MRDEFDRIFKEGQAFMDKGLINEAILRFEQALEKTYLMGSDTDALAVNEQLGKAYHALKDHEKALEYYKNNLSLYLDLKDVRGAVDSYNKIGQLLFSKADFKGALQFHMKCLELCKEEGYKEGEATALKNIGIVHSKLGNHVLALKTHTASLDIKRKMGDRRGEAMTLFNMGQSQIDAGDYTKARDNLKASLSVFKSLGLKEDAHNVEAELDELDELEEDMDLELEVSTKMRPKKLDKFPGEYFIKGKHYK